MNLKNLKGRIKGPRGSQVAHPVLTEPKLMKR